MGDIDRVRPAADRTVGTAGGAAITLALTPLVGPPAAALVGSITGPWIEELSHGMRSFIERRRARVHLAIEVAEDHTGRPIEEITNIALRDDLRSELFLRALEAAATSAEEQKVRALGRALAIGVIASDDTVADENLRVVTTLAQLEPVDLRVLDAMATPNTTWRARDNSRNSSVVETVPGVDTVVDSVIAKLSSLGLITDSTDGSGIVMGSAPWRATRFGTFCIEALRAIGTAEQ